MSTPASRARPGATLEAFPNPQRGRDYTIRMSIPEFTCLCPRTGQPDFATLELEGELRGCIGYLHRDEDLVSLTRRAVVAAALEDPRFGVVLREEVPRLSISVTVLAFPVVISDISEVVIGRDGLLVERGGARGLLLPQVAVKRGWDREVFVSQTCRKAGLPPDAWRDGVTVVRRFEAVHFEESA